MKFSPKAIIKSEIRTSADSIKKQVVGDTSSQISEDPKVEKTEISVSTSQLENEMAQLRKQREKMEIERKQSHEHQAAEEKHSKERSVVEAAPGSVTKIPDVAKNAEMGKKKH